MPRRNECNRTENCGTRNGAPKQCQSHEHTNNEIGSFSTTSNSGEAYQGDGNKGIGNVESTDDGIDTDKLFRRRTSSFLIGLQILRANLLGNVQEFNTFVSVSPPTCSGCRLFR